MLEIRLLLTLADMRAAVELQKTFWGDDSESLVPTHMLFSIANYGGHVVGAYDGDRLVGLLIGFLGAVTQSGATVTTADLQFASKRMVVLPEYRSHGIGSRLKMAQRELALAQGIHLVTWTFDPLMALNAHLNIRKLGCICRTYYPDHYGTEETGGLTLLGSSDRLLAEWWVNLPRVQQRRDAGDPALSLETYLEQGGRLFGAAGWDESGFPALPTDRPDSRLLRGGVPVLLEIPSDYKAIAHANPDLGRAWRCYTREAFVVLFVAGWQVTDFVHQEVESRNRAFYVLLPVETFSLNGG
jgi:predicted GNAT superfamily acetyltransferase